MRLGEKADRHTILTAKPDVLVVAVGAEPCAPDIPGASGGNVALAEEVLAGERAVHGSVAVIGGGMVGCETAEYIWQRWGAAERSAAGDDAAVSTGAPAAAGAPRNGVPPAGTVTGVTVLEMLDRMAANVSATSRPFFLARLREQGIRLVAGAEVVKIAPEGVVVRRKVDGAEMTESVAAHTVVLATGYRVAAADVAEFTDLVAETYVIGDCAGARMIRDAMVEGFATGRAV
jgi:pyruvate/2-oxoglutarate dehydrogenase complex dihydrolipoamide dehydrogenase (E3) component